MTVPPEAADLLWHGERLCLALSRAWEAERRVRELEAAAFVLLDLFSKPGRVPESSADGLGELTRAITGLAAVVYAGAPRMPQDAPEPPPIPEAVPTLSDASPGIVGGYVEGVRRRLGDRGDP